MEILEKAMHTDCKPQNVLILKFQNKLDLHQIIITPLICNVKYVMAMGFKYRLQDNFSTKISESVKIINSMDETLISLSLIIFSNK